LKSIPSPILNYVKKYKKNYSFLDGKVSFYKDKSKKKKNYLKVIEDDAQETRHFFFFLKKLILSAQGMV